MRARAGRVDVRGGRRGRVAVEKRDPPSQRRLGRSLRPGHCTRHHLPVARRMKSRKMRRRRRRQICDTWPVKKDLTIAMSVVCCLT